MTIGPLANRIRTESQRQEAEGRRSRKGECLVALCCGDEIGVDVFRLKIPELPVGLVAPAQEPANDPAPLLHRRWRESALIAHPCHILVELALAP